jgi:hypothetical protein
MQVMSEISFPEFYAKQSAVKLLSMMDNFKLPAEFN